jgi:uncharacterized protein YbcC (UPF0753/DUF2309 family)
MKVWHYDDMCGGYNCVFASREQVVQEMQEWLEEPEAVINVKENNVELFWCANKKRELYVRADSFEVNSDNPDSVYYLYSSIGKEETQKIFATREELFSYLDSKFPESAYTRAISEKINGEIYVSRKENEDDPDFYVRAYPMGVVYPE